MSITNQLRKKRKEKNLAVADIADQLGIARSTYYRYEQGVIENMSSSTLMALSEILDTTPQELLGWKSEPVISVENSAEFLTSAEYEELHQFLLYLLYRRTLVR
ncbi:MAG: helix-turn-helix transcriptional regulator [Tissierellia bacterium]|jgi:transcriptional regulator with XRE-family HTH domain|nr:helix-turn-helix transcriptional regulator [Bacillota bacterium]NLL22800.1 helix-turn-helix transcriptional regulator [Tissierellia bacterium]